MTHCAKCGAELIGSRKFCAACGTPVTDPRGSKKQAAVRPPSDPDAGRGPSSRPLSEVNPFAQTASPVSRSSGYGPPPTPSSANAASAAPSPPPKSQSVPPLSRNPIEPPVSPLATSNVNSDRGAFEAVVASSRVKIAGTEAMSVPQPPVAQPPSSAVVSKGRTQVIGALSKPLPSKPGGAQHPAQSAPGGGGGAPASAWGGQAAASGAPAYAAPPAPGARVTVTWANGQRYPGTVQQVSGNQCLVVFTDGQQRWVDTKFVTLA